MEKRLNPLNQVNVSNSLTEEEKDLLKHLS